ncbi:jg3042 [Pararge aegeria aegeria]|uniref:Jg3042 protein n=1 Tax=Pararge aegeria aegeria TaxID=348720 RepID=A0A8S4RVB9_9NEOP|nr:jg3042 [Pararge aegeria aegeria]
MCTGEAWRTPGVARSPSHESVTTELSLFSVSSAASDARMLRLLACKAGQGPDPTLRVASPNPEGKLIKFVFNDVFF